MVRAAGLEPARPFGLKILSLVRLPFRQARTGFYGTRKSAGPFWRNQRSAASLPVRPFEKK